MFIFVVIKNVVMRLFHLFPKEKIEGENPWSPWYDNVFVFVVRAENEEEARKLANENGGDEKTRGNPWLDANYSECIDLTEGDKGVIIRDFVFGKY